ncbi:MAG: hypothetical protein QOH93_209 [Chloroflexia bacterium]|jgi:hypothetical protein|nr:hypothetical protein [Chloroflexia bacterium]
MLRPFGRGKSAVELAVPSRLILVHFQELLTVSLLDFHTWDVGDPALPSR